MVGSSSAPRPNGLHLLALVMLLPSAFEAGCPGSVDLDIQGVGVETAWVVRAPAGGQIDVSNGQITAHMGGRAYLADTCMEQWYEPKHYLALKLLGKAFHYSVDMTGARCGCVLAVYLVSMAQNTQACNSNDYYCDANSLCGVRCTEIDLQEANQMGWRSTMHNADDAWGAAAGSGGPGGHDWSSEDYGPGKRCIDTTRPFDVSVSFPIGPDGSLAAMETMLSQGGKPCNVTGRVTSYAHMQTVSAALAAGMTPVVSYWNSDELAWLDQPPCQSDDPDVCAESVKYYGFSVRDIASPISPTITTTTTTKLIETATTTRTRSGSTSSANTSANGSANTATLVQDVEAGFCCIGAADETDFCGTCFRNAAEDSESKCSHSSAACELCGHGSTWCSRFEGRAHALGSASRFDQALINKSQQEARREFWD